MPAINKKWMKENMEDEDREISHSEDATPTSIKNVGKRSAPPGPGGMLKGLDGEVLLEKRKRFVPPAELKLSEWLDNNLEKRTEEKISLTLLYKYYTELCQESESDILDVPKFNRMIKVKFGKSFGVQAASIYKTLFKEQKLGKKKTGSGYKMKDIVIEAINHFGNPWQGVRFFVLKQYVGSRFPALQIDHKPKILKRALNMGVDYGYVELTKGIGMAGSYRLPGAVEPPAKPKSKTKKGHEGEEGKDDSSPEKDEDDMKEKGSADEESDATKTTEKEESEKKDSSPKPAKPKKVPTWSYSKISHSNPSKIEDTFPLAITYQSAPKAAGINRIRRYILEKYREEVPDTRWRKCLDHGLEKGYWEYASAAGKKGSIHLLMDDFDPNSEKLEDRICAAIIACHDPKTASATQIKKYVSQYHPDFNVDNKPDRFKKALHRAMDMKMIKQLSGIGANGTFMLVVPFIPTPSELAGEDNSDDEDEDDDSDYEAENTYVPKGTKSRGRPKIKTMEIIPSKKSKTSSSSSSKVMSKKLVAAAVNGRKKGSIKEVLKNKSNKGKGGSSSRGRKKKLTRAPSPLTDEEEEEEEEEDHEPEYTPKKSQSRGGSKSKSPGQAKKGGKKGSSTPKPKPTPKKSSPKKAISAPVDLSSDDEDDYRDMVEYTPRKSASRGGGKNQTKSEQNGNDSPSKSSKKRKAAGSYSDEEDDEEDYSPKKKKSKGGKNKKARK